jgi:hypothetical protein
MPAEGYLALRPGRGPAPITPERHGAILRRIADNRSRAESKGAPREGPSLLAGLVSCARRGHRRAVHYGGRGSYLRYHCASRAAGCCPPRRRTAGRALDRLVTERVRAALRPGALELSLAAAEDVLRERQRLDEHGRQRLGRGRYQAERAERQYRAVGPENRPAARAPERPWEEALQGVRRLEEDDARFRRQQPAALAEREVAQVRALAQGLPALGQAPTTTAADRQQIVRSPVEHVAVDIDGQGGRVRVRLTWGGGQASEHGVARAVLRYEQTEGFGRLLGRIRELRGQGLQFKGAAERLKAEGFRPVKRADRFTAQAVWRALRHRTPSPRPLAERGRGGLQEDEWFMADLAAESGVPKKTLYAWLRRGWVRYRVLKGSRAPRACGADAGERRRLRRLRRPPHGWWGPPLRAELTTPKDRPAE